MLNLCRALVFLVVGALSASGAAGQADTLPPPRPAPEVVQEEYSSGVSPLGAFLRAIVVPGWGHAAVGAHGRGGFYLTTQAVSTWMMVKTARRRSSAEDLRALREAQLRADLASEGITDETTIQNRLEADDGWAGADRLAGARQQQFEDWLALSIFTVLLGGADALVSAHLQDFPDVTLTPTNDDGRMELRVSVPLGGS
ncbi:MAG: hypothetical protein HKN71_07085 [Gemmatimonadetes bacterium]|nr:hypothetical protein [Gemmatimonadota bacterium]